MVGHETLELLARVLGGLNRSSSHPWPPAPSPVPLGLRAYKRRNVIERMGGRLKNWRWMATRYDRLAPKYLAGLALVSVVVAWT